jgi:hypothetical protein
MPPDAPLPSLVAERLGLAGVLDRSKVNAAAAFYLPSCPYGALDMHQAIVVSGAACGQWLIDAALALQEKQEREALEEQEAAAARLAARIAQGYNPDDSLIEKIRSHFDLAAVLESHGYAKSRTGTFRHPASKSGCFGASIKAFSGVERVFSHNAGDPLHSSNLPHWCTVKAIDALDAVVVLDFGGDRDRALRELATRFNLNKAPARKAVAKAIFKKLRQLADQGEIEAAAYTCGFMNGLTREEVCAVAHWVVSQSTPAKEAA